MRKKMVQKLLVFSGIVFAAGAIFYFVVMLPAFSIQEEVRALPIAAIKFSSVRDGKYQGQFVYNQVSTNVEINVKNHRIEDINILGFGNTEQAKTAVAELEKRILGTQSLDVDVVTGATTSSKAFLKSVENALSKGVSN